MTFITTLEEELVGGQRQQLIRGDDLADAVVGPAVDAVLALMRSD